VKDWGQFMFCFLACSTGVRSHSENDDHVSDHRENHVCKQEVKAVLSHYESLQSMNCLSSGRLGLRKSYTKL
jgi:hypothetical protein